MSDSQFPHNRFPLNARQRKLRVRLGAAVLGAALVLAACGSDGDDDFSDLTPDNDESGAAQY